jgi:hypothetical protein
MSTELRPYQREFLMSFADGEPHRIADRTVSPAANLIRREMLAYTGKPSMYRLTPYGRSALGLDPEVALPEKEPLTPEREILTKVVEDYDRRREHWWGRFLLWLLRKTT